MKNKIFIFIDVVAAKNRLQVSAINKCGYEATFLAYNFNQKADDFLGQNNKQILLSKKWLTHIFQVFLALWKSRRKIHHLEIYSGSALSFLYLFMGKMMGMPAICVERGDILYYKKGGYNKLVRFSMSLCYKYSTLVWYRELYMKSLLEKAGAKNLFFLHNAIDVTKSDNEANGLKKDITFLWLNRVIPERKSGWFTNVLKREELKNTLNYLVGILPLSPYKNEQDAIANNKSSNLFLKEYCAEPTSYYKRAKFFVLPAEVVFANHSLLEAMSYGVVPLVSRQPGTELIVDDRQNGFVFEHEEKCFQNAIMEAFYLNDNEYAKYSEGARRKILLDFSEEKYFKGICELYSRLEELCD